MKVTHIGYLGPSTNVRAPRLGALDVDQLAAAIAALPARKPLGQPAADVVPITSRGAHQRISGGADTRFRFRVRDEEAPARG